MREDSGDPSKTTPAPAGWRELDLLTRHRVLTLERRYLFALPKITVGRVTREIVHELLDIAEEYETLLKGGAAVGLSVDVQQVRTKIGDAIGSAAWACEALHEPELARGHFVAAEMAYTRAGAVEQARRCRMELHRLSFYGASDSTPPRRPTRAAAR